MNGGGGKMGLPASPSFSMSFLPAVKRHLNQTPFHPFNLTPKSLVGIQLVTLFPQQNGRAAPPSHPTQPCQKHSLSFSWSYSSCSRKLARHQEGSASRSCAGSSGGTIQSSYSICAR